MTKNNFSSWPFYSTKEINAVKNVLLSKKVNYLTGEYGKIFEKKFAKYLSVKHCVAVSNGTVALELSLLAIGIKKNDEVIVTPRSYFSSASSIVKLGAIPIFVDVDINTQNITINSIKKNITYKTKAIICVHLAGYPCDMNAICKIAKSKNIKIIEDCSQAHGAKINNKNVGIFGDISAWSFCNDKIISTGGEGGMVSTDNSKYWKFVWTYKDQGKNFDKYFAKNKKNVFKYLHDSIGSNFRMTEMQSVIGINQLANLDKNILLRNKYAKLIELSIKDCSSVITTHVKKNYTHAFYRYYFFIDKKFLKKKWSRDRIIKSLNIENISCGSGSCPEIYLEKPFKSKINFPKKKRLANATTLSMN